MASGTHFLSRFSDTRRTRSDPNLIFIPHPHVGRSNLARTPKPQPLLDDYPLDASMDKYKKQQRQHEWDLRTNPVEDVRRTKMRKVKETAESNNHNHRNGTNLNFKSFSLHEKPQPHRGEGGGSRGPLARPGFEPHTLYKKSPNLSTGRSVNTKKLLNWRLACFMSKEYLTRGTLLGRPWPPQDSNNGRNPDRSQAKSGSLDREADEIRSEKEKLYHTLTDFLRAGDVHLPEIVNPSQLAAWLGINQ